MFKIVLVICFALIAVCSSNIGVPIECNRPNEEYSCGSACQRTCENLGEVCPIINIRCNDACYCIDGYARDKNYNCIPISQCPPKSNACSGKSRGKGRFP